MGASHLYADGYSVDSSCCRLLAQRALVAALRAMSDLSSDVSSMARALPPILAASFPGATAAGVFTFGADPAAFVDPFSQELSGLYTNRAEAPA